MRKMPNFQLTVTQSSMAYRVAALFLPKWGVVLRSRLEYIKGYTRPKPENYKLEERYYV
jgi:hypothetical protein